MSTKQKISSFNMNNLKKGVSTQQIQKNSTFNSSIKLSKRSKPRQQQKPIANTKYKITTVKLPTIVKKITSSTIHSTSSSFIQNSSKWQTPSSTVINEPLSSISKIFKPVIHLPSIKDHVLKQNLTQKPALRCKTPRPESAYSRSNTIVIPELEEPIKTRHPLQRMDVGSLLSESARHRLKRLFNKLDTDKDGHLLYSQVQKCIPSNLPRAQLTFFRVLYDIISDQTYFGLQEFYATAIIVEMIAKQDSKLWNTLLDDVDFNYYHNNILQLIEEYNIQCYSDIGIITYEKLLELITKRTRNNKIDLIKNQFEYFFPKIQTIPINRLDFLALLPTIIYIESCFDHNQKLFRFRENSILDLHMNRQILLT